MQAINTDRKSLSPRQFGWINTAYWGGLLLIDLLQTFAWQSQGEGFDLGYQVMQYGPFFFWLWITSWGLYRWFVRHRHISWRLMTPQWIAIVISAAAVNLLLTILLSMTLIRFFRGSEYAFVEALYKNLLRMYPLMIGMVVQMMTLILVLYVIEFYQKYRAADLVSRDLEVRLTQAELMTLRMQLQPHFLFNAMNTIAMQVRGGQHEQAVEMLSGLSGLLRKSLARSGQAWVSLQAEFDLVRAYLQIEEQRFSDTLQVHWDIADAALKYRIPNLLLQPLVENACKHGVARALGPARIEIQAHVVGQFLHIRISNTGPELPPGFSLTATAGIGLRNTRTRLKSLFGEDFRLGLTQCAPDLICLDLHLPAVPFTS